MSSSFFWDKPIGAAAYNLEEWIYRTLNRYCEEKKWFDQRDPRCDICLSTVTIEDEKGGVLAVRLKGQRYWYSQMPERDGAGMNYILEVLVMPAEGGCELKFHYFMELGDLNFMGVGNLENYLEESVLKLGVEPMVQTKKESLDGNENLSSKPEPKLEEKIENKHFGFPKEKRLRIANEYLRAFEKGEVISQEAFAKIYGISGRTLRNYLKEAEVEK